MERNVHARYLYRFDMTGEVLDYMEAALKLQETGKRSVLSRIQ